MARALFSRCGGGLLYILGGAELPPYQREGAVEIVRFYESIPNYLERALHFSGALAGLVAEQPELRIAHFRDPWSGVALLDRAEVPYKTVYEINGLPRRDLSRKPRAAASLPEASRLQKALHRRRSAAKPAGLLSVARGGGDEC